MIKKLIIGFACLVVFSFVLVYMHSSTPCQAQHSLLIPTSKKAILLESYKKYDVYERQVNNGILIEYHYKAVTYGTPIVVVFVPNGE